MTRTTRTDQIVVKPQNDVFTGLAAAATVILILGLIALFMTASEKFGDGLFGSSGAPTATR